MPVATVSSRRARYSWPAELGDLVQSSPAGVHILTSPTVHEKDISFPVVATLTGFVAHFLLQFVVSNSTGTQCSL